MLRLPAQLDIGPYTVRLDVLAARLQRRRRRARQLLLASWLLLGLVLTAWLLYPVARGNGTLVVPAHADDLHLLLDRQPLVAGVQQVPAGVHTITIERRGMFPASVSVQVTRGQTTTLALPVLRPIPLARALPRPHEQSAWLQAGPDAGGGWRLSATRPVSEQAGPRPGWGQVQTEPGPYLLHLDASGLTRLPVLESYPVADEIITDGARFWAMWEPHNSARTPEVAGRLTLATPTGTRVISTTTRLQGIWWAPGGRRLLVALPHAQGVDLGFVDPHRPRLDAVAPVITVAGNVQSIVWHPDGSAVVVSTTLDAPAPAPAIAPQPAHPAPTVPAQTADQAGFGYAAVLVRPASQDTPAQATRLRAAPRRPGGLLPLAWAGDALWWVSDTGLGLALDRVSLIDGAVERIGWLPATTVALTVLPDHSIRLVRTQADGRLAIQRWPEEQTLFTLPDVHAHGPAGGSWQHQELILATSPTALWYIQIPPEALQ